VTRDAGAKLIKKYYFEISPRSLERWPIPWRRLNGRAHAETRDLFAYAEAVLAASPAITAGRHRQTERDA
jgi:hypothetical protein